MNLKRLACVLFALVMILGMCPATQVFSLPVDEDGEVINLTGEYVEDEDDYVIAHYMTLGDALVGESTNYDTAEGVDSYLDLIEEVGINRLYWRGIQQFIMSESNSRAQNPWISLHETLMGYVINGDTGNYHGLNLDQYLVQECHKRGIEVVAVMSLWDWTHEGDYVSGAGVGFSYFDELLGTCQVDQYGLITRSSMDYSNPEARHFAVGKLMQWLKFNGYDGIQFLTYSENYQIRFDDQFGYSDYAVNDYINNIYKRNGQWVTPGYGNWTDYGSLLDWQMHRGNYITQFFRELRTEMDAYKEGLKLGIFMDPRNLRQSQHWYAVTGLQPSDSSYFDYETWFQEGLVTEVIVYGANDVGLQKKAIEDLMWMARGTDARIGPYTSYPWSDETWTEYYKQGGFTCTYYWRPFEIYSCFKKHDESYYDAQGQDAVDKYWLRKAYLGSVDCTMEELMAFLEREDNNYYALTAATIVVTKFPEEASPILEKLLTHPDPGVRVRAMMLIKGQFSNNKTFFTDNTFDQIIRSVKMDGLSGSCVIFDVGKTVLQMLAKEDETVYTRLWELFEDPETDLYMKAFIAHTMQTNLPKYSNLTVEQAHNLITGEFAYDPLDYNATDMDVRLEARLKNLVVYYLSRVISSHALSTYPDTARAMELVEYYVRSDNSVMIYNLTTPMYEIANGITGEKRTWCLEQLETVFQRMSDSVETNFADDFHDWGAFYMARYLDKFGAEGRAILEKYYFGDDRKLAVAAWEQMYIPQPETGFVFMTEKEYAEAYTKLPEAMLCYDKECIIQNFENYSDFPATLNGLGGSDRKTSGRWGGYNRANTIVSAEASFSGRQSTLFKGSVGGFYSSTTIGPDAGMGHKLSMWVNHDGGAKFYASVGAYGAQYGSIETGFMISEDGSIFLYDVDAPVTSTNEQIAVRDRYVADTGLDIPLNTWIQVSLIVNRSDRDKSARVSICDEAGNVTEMTAQPEAINMQENLGIILYDHEGASGNSKTYIDDVEWREKGMDTAAIRPEKIIYEDTVVQYDGKPHELPLTVDPSTNITSVQYVYYDEDDEIMFELPVEAGIYTVSATVLDGGDYQGTTKTAKLEIRKINTEQQGTLACVGAKVGTVLSDTKFVTDNVKVVQQFTDTVVEGTFQWENPGTWILGPDTHNYVFVPTNPNYKEIRGSIYVPATADKYITSTVLSQNFDNTSIFVPGKAGTAVASGAGGSWAGLADSVPNGSVISTGTYTKPIIIPPQNQALILKRGAEGNIGRVSLRGTELPADAEYEITYRLFWQSAFSMYIGYGQDHTKGDSIIAFDADGNLSTFDASGAIVKDSTHKIPKNAWSTVKLTTNRAAGTYTVTVTPDEGQAFTVNGVLQGKVIQHIYFLGHYNNTQIGYLDDFQMDRIVSGQRQTVYKQNFDDNKVFSASKYLTQTLYAKSSEGGEWRVETKDSVKILAAELVSNIGLPNPNYQQLHLFRGKNNGDGWTNVRFANNIAATEDYEISFRMTWQNNMGIYFGYSSEATADSYITIKDGYLHVYDSAADALRKDTAGQMQVGVWSTVKVVSDRATGKFTVTVTPDGGTAFSVTGDLLGKELSRIYFQGMYNDNDLGYLDDLKVVKKTAEGTTTIVEQDFENTEIFNSNEALTATKEVDASGTGGKWNMRIESGTSHKWINSTAPVDEEEEEEEEEEAPVEQKDVVSSGTQALKLVRLDGNKGHVTVTLPSTINSNRDYTFSCRIYQPESRRLGIMLGNGTNSSNMSDATIYLPQEDGKICIFDGATFANKETGYVLRTGEWATFTLTTNRVAGTYTVTLQHDTDLAPVEIGTAELVGLDVSKIVFSCGYVTPEQTPCVLAYFDDIKLTQTYPDTRGYTKPTYKINLADGLTGAGTAVLNQTYFFEVDDWSNAYTYEFDVWMGDRDYIKEDEENDAALYFQDYKNGRYSIYNVTDDVKVSFTKRAKTYGVTAVGEASTSMSGAARATFNEDYTFKINENPAYDYLVKVLVRGLLYEPERDGNSYTIAGEDITGPITVQVNVTPCSDHTGGHAACGEKARCERCGAEYGRTGDHDLVKVDAKAPTLNEEGNILHYACTTCEKFYADEWAMEELKRRDLKLPALISYNALEAKISIEGLNLAIEQAGSAKNVQIQATNEEYPVSRVSLPMIPLKNLASAGKSLTIVTDKVSATMDKNMLAVIAENGGKEATFQVREILLEDLNKEQRAAVEAAECPTWQIIDAKLSCGDTDIHDFAGGKITMKIFFTPEEGASVREYQLWYIAEDGTIEKLSTRYEDGRLVANMSHFSQYLIVRTGYNVDWYVWVLLAVLILAAAAVVVLLILKKRKAAGKADEAAEGQEPEAPAEEAAEAEELSIEDQIEKAIQETTEV